MTNSYVEDSTILYHVSPDLSTARVVARYRHSRGYQTWIPENRMMLVDNTFDVATRAEVYGNQIFVADHRTARLSVLDTQGQRVSEYSLPGGTPLTDSLKAQITEERVRDWGNAADGSLLGRFWQPDSVPFTSGFRRDPLGMIWLRQYLPTMSASQLWFVYGGDGAYQGKVALPRALNVHEIGADRVLGTIVSPQSGTQVVLYQLTRTR